MFGRSAVRWLSPVVAALALAGCGNSEATPSEATPTLDGDATAVPVAQIPGFGQDQSDDPPIQFVPLVTTTVVVNTGSTGTQSGTPTEITPGQGTVGGVSRSDRAVTADDLLRQPAETRARLADSQAIILEARSLLEQSTAEPRLLESRARLVESSVAQVQRNTTPMLRRTVRVTVQPSVERTSALTDSLARSQTRTSTSATVGVDATSSGRRSAIDDYLDTDRRREGEVSLATPAAVKQADTPRSGSGTTAVAKSGARAQISRRNAAVQVRLHELGYDPGPADGDFGSMTRAAIWAFQKVQGTTPTGRLDGRLVAQLVDPVVPQPAITGSAQRRIEIDLDRQLMILWDEDKPALISHMSSGDGREFCTEERGCEIAATPVGNFAVTRRISGWRESYLGELYNPLYFMNGYAVHGYDDVPLGPVSHGCVRIPMHIAEYLPDIVSDGTAVHVIDA